MLQHRDQSPSRACVGPTLHPEAYLTTVPFVRHGPGIRRPLRASQQQQQQQQRLRERDPVFRQRGECLARLQSAARIWHPTLQLNRLPGVQVAGVLDGGLSCLALGRTTGRRFGAIGLRLDDAMVVVLSLGPVSPSSKGRYYRCAFQTPRPRR